MNDSIVNNIMQDLNRPEREKPQVEEHKKKIFNLESIIESNVKSLVIIQSNIEENRNMIISNYSSALSINSDLARKNSKNILENSLSLKSKIITHDKNEEKHLELEKDKVKLEHLDYQIELNEKKLNVLKKISELNSELIKVNEEIMNMNQYIVDFNKKNIQSNKIMMKSDFECPDVSPESLKESEDYILKTANNLEKKSKKNQEVAISLTRKTNENSTSIMKNRNIIHQRRESIMSNSESIEINKSKIFYNI
tara:strand:+ start:673 stop:1431 length:759 start_codon:yes stop_codon:yes gene_type:complete